MCPNAKLRIMQGVNDSLEDAQRLVSLVEGVAAKINLIEFNEHAGTQLRGSSSASISAFKQVMLYCQAAPMNQPTDSATP